MILYETTFIVNPQSDDAVIEEKVKAISELILANGGKIVHEDRMGTRRLAYPINKLHQGYYATFLHESDKSVLAILDRHMKLGEEYMRHLTIRFEADPERVYGDKKDDYYAPRGIKKRQPDSGIKREPVSKAPATEEADSLSETAEIKIVPSPVDAATDKKQPVSEIPATGEADSLSETAEIKIVPSPEDTATDKKQPVSEIPATGETDSGSETTKIEIVSSPDDAAAEEKKPDPYDVKPEDEEL